MGFGGYAFPPAKQGLGERWMVIGEEERNGKIPVVMGGFGAWSLEDEGNFDPDTHGVFRRHLYPSVYPVTPPPPDHHHSLS